MVIPYRSIILYLSQLVWPLARISGLFLSMPLISSVLMPMRTRVLFAFALAWLIMPLVPEHLSLLNFDGYYILYILYELLLGLLMGFTLQIVFQIFIIGGQIIALQAGLGFAVMVDPASRANVPLVSQFLLILVSLMFLALNGHLVLLEALIDSFRLKPIGTFTIGPLQFANLMTFSAWMVKESVMVALPAILSLLVVNLAFGIMTRVAPQLNIFSIGFPITLLMGIIIVRLCLPGIYGQIVATLQQGFLFMKGILH